MSIAPKVVFERENQLLLWVIIQLSGVLEDEERVCPRNRRGRPEEALNHLMFAGFFFPNQLATVMNAEVRDL